MRNVEIYIQEVAAAAFVPDLSFEARLRVRVLSDAAPQIIAQATERLSRVHSLCAFSEGDGGVGSG